MTKNAIVTIMLGSDPSYPYVEEVFARYATRIGVDLVTIKNERISYDDGKKHQTYEKAWLQKFILGELLELYDRILFLDADIVIHPRTDNIFEVFSDASKCYMFDEGELLMRNELVDRLASRLGQEFKASRHYYNTGVMLISRDSNILRNWNKNDLQQVLDVELFEQTYINYLIQTGTVPIVSLPSEYNRTGVSGPPDERFGAFFIHHAGSSYSKRSVLRFVSVINDICTLYKRRLSWTERLELEVNRIRYFLKRVFEQIVPND